jgi:hypothetical protein
MGGEASKAVSPPEDWEPKGASKSFKIISPVSDISNPSDIQLFHPKPSRTQLAPREGGARRLDRPLPSNRRISKTVATGLPLQAVSRNSRGSNDDIPPPNAFYFPTKETERYAEQRMKSIRDVDAPTQNKGNAILKDTKTRTRNIFKAMAACLDGQNDGEVELQDPPQVQSKLGFREDTNHEAPKSHRQVPNAASRRRSSQRADGNAQLVGAEAVSATTPRPEQVRAPLRELKNHSSEKHASSKEKSSIPSTKISSHANIGLSTAGGDTHEAQTHYNFDDGFIEKEHDEGLIDIDTIASLALHQEDAYFDRLSLSSTHEASPFVRFGRNSPITSTVQINPARQASDDPTSATSLQSLKSSRRTLPGSLNAPIDTPLSEMVKKPVRRSFPVTNDKSINAQESQISDAALLNTGDPRSQWNRHVFLPCVHRDNSPVSSLLRFYTKTGPMESSPTQSYNSEEEDSALIKVFTDDLSESSSHKHFGLLNRHELEVAASKRESQESQSSLYTAESNSYKKVDRKDLQLLGAPNAECGETQEVLSYFRTAEERGVVSYGEHRSREFTVANNLINHVASLGPAKSKGRGDKTMKRISKLESLFRPVLPALSSDDAQSTTSYDPYEIMVTESAPGMIQSEHHIALALRKPSPQSSITRMNKLASTSPSMISIDTQREQSPSFVKLMVSEQAESNAEFLFANDYGPVETAKGPDRGRDGSTLSISTVGARSRLTQRSFTQAKGVVIPVASQDDAECSLPSSSNYSYKSERRVRFSTETVKLDEKRNSTASKASRASDAGEISVPALESKSADLSYSVKEHRPRTNDGLSSTSSGNSSSGRQSSASTEEGLRDFLEGDDSGVTPDVTASTLGKAVNSPYLRFQEAKEKFGTNAASTKTKVTGSINLPEVQRTFSDLTETASFKGRRKSDSSETFKSLSAHPEADEKADLSPETSIHWTYSENGVTPYVKGNPLDNATKSPFIRFKNAKNRFSLDDGKELPTKSPKKVTKVPKKGSGGLVSARIEELNSRVAEIRKIKRMRKKMANPRLHTHNFDNKQPVRNRALLNYETNMNSANIGKRNTFMAAKFNVIPDVDEDDNSSCLTSGTNAKLSPRRASTGDEHDDDDEVSKLSEAMSSVACSSVATIRQQRDASHRSRSYSETTLATASTGLTNIKKQVFRVSDASRSLTSNGDSTTLSAIISKENESYLPFRAGTFNTVKPTEHQVAAISSAHHLSSMQRTPVQAMKWRSLAVAAHEKDVMKAGASIKKQTRGLSLRNINA